jgi:MFS superfamily sulfate permease-like transporter
MIGTLITLLIYIKKITNSDANISVFREWDFCEKKSLKKYIKNQQDWDLILTKFSSWLNYLNIENQLSKIEKLNANQKVIISLSHITNIDIDGIEAIDEMIDILQEKKIDVYISWINSHHGCSTKLKAYESLLKNGKIFSSSTQALEKLKV